MLQVLNVLLNGLEFCEEALFGGVDISAVDFNGNNDVTFDALGVPSNGGTVTLGFGNRQVAVAMDSLTGKVSVNK